MLNEVLTILLPLALVIGIDLVFLLFAWLAIGFLAKRKRAAFAVLRRNFLAYFSNPTGYVFLCLFVLLTSMAAFWPNEFFNANLANLDQLNFWFPVIMLFFIPAITMSIWSDERRQGTDELLLTLPADDFDIVVGKFLSAVSIYTVSLIFSQLSTFLVLLYLSAGGVDAGLFCANYLGYWFVGVAMIAIGMVASFLTANLTVAFILGALFNAPLAFAANAEVIIARGAWSRLVAAFSFSRQFDNFGRGVVSIAPVAFFTLLTLTGLYLCIVLIGRRHWSGGTNGNRMFAHYLVRCIALAVVVLAGSYFFMQNDRPRFDVTQGKVSSLSPTTRQLIRNLDPERPIVIEAFVSNNIPEQYSKTRYDLVTLLKEFQSLAGGRNTKLQVQLYDNLETSSPEAQRARKQYGIEPQMIRVRQRGAFRDQEVLLGAAVRSGLSKVVVPFFDSGIPVEYELARSINTAAQPRRAKLGVVNTDANFMGGFSMAGGSFRQVPKQPIIEELEKQYSVEGVDASDPIPPGKYDALLVVQPSSLGPPQLKNLVDAVQAGVPTAIFEDPLPVAIQGVPGTSEPKEGQGGMFGGSPPQPKGDMQALWKTLGLKISQTPGMQSINPDVVWQRYNPHPRLRYLLNATDQWLFIREEAGDEADYLSEKSLATAGLRELMFLYAGAISADKENQDVQVTPIIRLRPDSGIIKFDDVMSQLRSGEPNPTQLQVLQGPALGEQVVAVYVEGVSAIANPGGDGLQGDASNSAENQDQAQANAAQQAQSNGDAERKLRAFYVADIDCMAPFFSANRRRPEDYEDISLRVQNITFVLNVIDVLAGETNYPKIRSHEPQHVTLRLFEDLAQEFQSAEVENQKVYQEEFNRAIREAEEQNQRSVAKFQDRINEIKREGAVDPAKQQTLIAELQRLQIQNMSLERKLGIQRQKLEADRDEKIRASRMEADLRVLGEQARYKYMAILLPPIPPLLVGIAVFVSRRVREREGISKTRLR
ncbi:MAG: Gldg family protein [Pirellulaceae bacterium]|nr:Gldg family protein [Pirellulaceae bacterium]